MRPRSPFSNAESSKKNAITTQHQPRAHRAELMRFASSELLKIETALVRKPSGRALSVQRTGVWSAGKPGLLAALLRAARYGGHTASRWAGPHCTALRREAVWR